MSEANIPINQSQLLSESLSLSEKEIEIAMEESRQYSQAHDPDVNSSQVDELPPKTVQEKPTKPSKEFLKNADWYAIARRLRQHNRQLVQKIVALEKSLSEYEETLEIKKRDCRAADNLIEQKTQELNYSHLEITRLSHELDNAHQEHQRQQILIENLSQQLQTSQERIAILERECSLMQDNYGQQQHQLLKAEKNNRELQIRLQRQQRYTLQFKAALDQCLESPSEENSNETLDKKVELQLQAIQSWSNYQQTVDSVPTNDNLLPKLLADQEIEISEIQSEEKLELEAETASLSENIPSEDQEKIGKNPLLQEEEDALDNEQEQQQPSKDINLPLEEQQVTNQNNQIENYDSKIKPRKKGFLQLPKLPKFSR